MGQDLLRLELGEAPSGAGKEESAEPVKSSEAKDDPKSKPETKKDLPKTEEKTEESKPKQSSPAEPKKKEPVKQLENEQPRKNKEPKPESESSSTSQPSPGNREERRVGRSMLQARVVKDANTMHRSR